MNMSAITATDWKVGDKCFFEFKAGTVKKVESDGRVTELSDECGCLSGHDLRNIMQPTSLSRTDVVALSAEFSGYYHQISDANCGLNIPDIHRWLVQQWMAACNNGDIKKIRCRIVELKKIIMITCSVEFEGMRIFR